MRRAPQSLLLSALLALVAALLVSACGDGGAAGSDEDVDTLLEQTFSGDKKIESGVVDFKASLDAQGAQDGSFGVTLGGPFQSQGDKELPQFAMTAKVTGQGQNIEAGAISTGDKGFIAFNGRQYAVSDQVFAEFKRGYEQAQARQSGQEDQSLASLGIDPRQWLTDPENQGEADVGGEETIKITGGVNVARLLDDINNVLRKAAELGAAGAAQVPERLTEAQKRQVQEAVSNLRVEIYTGAEDKILRRMRVDADLETTGEAQGGPERAAVTLDLTLTGVNEDQEIEAPADARPFEELTQQLGSLGLGGLGGGQSGGGAGGSGGASSEALEEYSNCIRDAGNDAAKAQQCADLLTAP